MRTMRQGLKWTIPVMALALILSGCGLTSLLDVGEAVAATGDSSYAIVDTNQSKTYGNTSEISAPAEGQPFYGQDAQIDGNQPSYADNGDGTVTDLVTGLMWQQGYSGKMTYSEAVALADSFELASYTDWRLPTIKELYSLIDFSGEDVNPEAGSANDPFIDTETFDFEYGDTSAGERIIDSQWATSTLYTGSSNFGQLMFGVNFADGRIKGYGTGYVPGRGEKTFFVRFVRGNTAYGENDFVDNGDGTITDLATGLMWSQADSGSISSSGGDVIASNGGAMDWEEALAYVVELNNANYLGYSDWYLPNAKELQSIVDYTRSPGATNSAAIDPIFNATSITNEDGQLDWGFYWTGTTHVSQRGGQAAVYIAFGRGLGYMNGQFIDVHGAGCQRSDPKTGSPSYGFGPQGDVQRVANFVRVVRDVDGSSTASSGSFGSPNSPVLGSVGGDEDAGNTTENYILFAPLGGSSAYLIDRSGAVVHDWTLSGQPGNSVYLTEGGNLLATYTIQGSLQQGGVGGGVELLTWDGEEAWSFELATDHAHLHHDVDMLPDGNVLMISWEVMSRSDALAAGLSANQLPASGEVWSEMILEYDPDLDQVVWEWHLWDHRLPTGWVANANPNKIDLGFASNRQSEDWWHFNSIDYSAELDQIVVSSRAASEIWIIDHDLTTAEAAGAAGDLLYRFGNPVAYGGTGSQVLVNQHDAEFISSGTAGPIRILVFDNGDPRTRPYSRVLELELPDYGNGLFEDATIVWSYGAASGDEYFWSDHISGAQRHESGNTLICSGVEGRFFEVTPAGETVWEYVNPFTGTGPDGKENNEVFRCESYSAEYIGQDLDSSSTTSLASTPNSVGTGTPVSAAQPVPAPQGIREVDPSVLNAGATSQLVTIHMDPRLMPPDHVQFTRVAIGNITATSWSRNGDTLRAWFDIPAQLASGEYALTVTFPGRNSNPITFRYPFGIR